jgi:galactokinase
MMLKSQKENSNALYYERRKKMNGLVERLEAVHNERKRLRRIMFRRMRDNKDLLKRDGYIQRKMRLNYLGDLTDNKVISYMKKIDHLRGNI